MPEDLVSTAARRAAPLRLCGGGAIELMEAVRLAPERVEERFADFFGSVKGGAEGWDGSEPLRPVES